MAYRCNFLDNQVYSAADVNDVFACLTSGGVTFNASDSVLSALNEATAQAVGDGVLSDESSCKVVKDGEKYKILPGACFMYDGSVIIFSDGGENVSIPENVKSYVYLERNQAKNSIDIVASQSAPGEKCVTLAEISEDGEISDKRKYAVSRVMIGVGGTLKNATAEFKECNYENSETVSVDMGSGNFSYIIIRGGTYKSSLGEEETRFAVGKNFAELSEDETICMHIGRNENQTKEFVYAKKNGQFLELYITGTNNKAEYVLNISVI